KIGDISGTDRNRKKRRRKMKKDRKEKRTNTRYSQSLGAESSSHERREVVWKSEIEVGSGDFLRLRRIRIPSCINRYRCTLI
ncbi:hypothetical protein NL444_27585, partial [Klebsiella pneumoniae]|nr:hypothetical protein [Klebsiella pneumoniae]